MRGYRAEIIDDESENRVTAMGLWEVRRKRWWWEECMKSRLGCVGVGKRMAVGSGE